MKLRPELEPEIEKAEELFPQVMELISEYDNGCDNDDGEKIQAAIDKINILTNKHLKADDLFEYWESESREELAFKISLPDARKVDNISNDELLEIIRRIQSFDDEGISDKLSEMDVPLSDVLTFGYYIPLLKRNFSYPEPYGLFNRQLINGEYIEHTAEEIAGIILSHKPFAM